ncbi:MAG TPA: hypothetical protein VG326_03020 [Tepidisphaeraceae bacterium]|nr:hypothetical protein [Tepidisphaeraceae bacterium]
MKNVIAWVGVLGALTANGSPEPKGAPASQPSSKISAAAVMPEGFNPLLSRCIFARKNGAAMAGTARSAGSGWILRGVVRDEDGGYTAIVEDPITRQIRKLENGATLVGGNISHLTLHGFQYEMGGKCISVAIGQNLAGETAIIAPPAPAATAGAKGQNAPATAPSDVGELPPDAAQAAALIAASPNAADGVKPENGNNRRGRPSHDN